MLRTLPHRVVLEHIMITRARWNWRWIEFPGGIVQQNSWHLHLTTRYLCECRGFLGRMFEYCVLLGHDGASRGSRFQTFRRFLMSDLLDPWRWTHYISSELRVYITHFRCFVSIKNQVVCKYVSVKHYLRFIFDIIWTVHRNVFA